MHYDSIGVIQGMRHLPATFTPGERIGPGLDATLEKLQVLIDEQETRSTRSRQRSKDARRKSADTAVVDHANAGVTAVVTQEARWPKASGRPLPPAHPGERVLLDIGRGRPVADSGMRVVLGADPSASAGLPLLPRATDGGAGRLGLRHPHRIHGQPPLRSARACPTPFVIAQVALEEDPRVRLTTNTVECDAEQLELGMRMEVVFEADGDVWLPLFRPAAEQGRTLLRCRRTRSNRTRSGSTSVRPMVTQEKFEDKVAITGVGMSEIGRRLMVSPIALTIAGLRARRRRCRPDDGRHRRPVDLPGRRAPRSGSARAASARSSPPSACAPPGTTAGIETFGPGGSVIAAMLAVASGLATPRALLPDAVGVDLQRTDAHGRASPRPVERTTSWMMPFGAMLRGTHAGPERPAALPPLRDDPRDPRLDRVEPAGECRAQPDRDLPRPDDHGRLPVRTHRSPRPSGSTTATSRATVPSPSSSPRPKTPRDLASRRSASKRSAPRSSSGSSGTRAPSPTNRRSSGPPRTCGHAPRCVPRTSTSPSCTTDSASTACPGSKHWASAGSAKRRTSSTAERTSPATASSRSTRTAASSRTAAPTAWVSSTRRSPSCAARAGDRQVRDARVAVVSSGGLTPGSAMLLRSES